MQMQINQRCEIFEWQHSFQCCACFLLSGQHLRPLLSGRTWLEIRGGPEVPVRVP